ncbi:glycosyltransferase family 2 protein [Candidatus Ruminimicrobium bovinum]|uniref:glycosyltransferase family 2 protein n=1 Tax=Candidatus Ruminimicrobium bovinum TaxID=3242779 RepID=UPI0039B9BA3B
MPKISVIVPVYNVEKYLSQCLDSILNQTFKDFECICVNDGSTDNSLSVLQEYVNKDNRIKIINQENRGLPGARNSALKIINGKYITFIDSDDFVSSDYLEKLTNIAEKENSDIVYCRHKMYYSLDNKYEKGPNREKLNTLFYEYSKSRQTDKQLECILDIVENSRSACMKLYKTDVIKDNTILFFEDIYAEEDFAFNILANLYSNKISFLDEELYYYRKQVDSLTAKKEKLRINALRSFITLTNFLYKRNLLENSPILQNFIINGFVYRLGKKFSKSKQKEMYPYILEHFLYLKSILKSSFFRVGKINFYILIIKIFNIKSFVIFRMLKNF